MRRRLNALTVLLTLAPTLAAAQTIAGPVKAGDCVVTVQLPQPAAARTEIELQINKKALPRVPADEGKPTVQIVLTGPVGQGDEIRARRVVGGQADPSPGSPFTVLAGDGTVRCTADSRGGGIGDGREAFEASGYVGTAVDNFAPASVGGYENSQAGGKQIRAVGGFDFEFRLVGTPDSGRQIWIFGETLHGVRSADINCASTNDDKPAVCDKLTSANAQKQLQFVLENATSMEAYTGVRVELLTLQSGTAKLYATARLGVMMLNGEATSGGQTFKANHAYRTHHFGGGLLMPKGKFGGSLLEVGWGRTDIFDNPATTNHWRRLKIDGSLNVQLVGAMYGFVQLYADFDPKGKSADSVQTFFGLSFEIPEFFK